MNMLMQLPDGTFALVYVPAHVPFEHFIGEHQIYFIGTLLIGLVIQGIYLLIKERKVKNYVR